MGRGGEWNRKRKGMRMEREKEGEENGMGKGRGGEWNGKSKGKRMEWTELEQ